MVFLCQDLSNIYRWCVIDCVGSRKLRHLGIEHEGSYKICSRALGPNLELRGNITHGADRVSKDELRNFAVDDGALGPLSALASSDRGWVD